MAGPKKGHAKEVKLKKAKYRRLLRMTDEVRDHTLKSYFHLCKEMSAKMFIEWRIKQKELLKDPILKKALRIRHLSNFQKYDKEEIIFKLYKENVNSFDSIKD